jgi:hypothetical protein
LIPADRSIISAGIADAGSLLRSHDDRRDIRRIDGRVEKLGAGQLRKMHELVAYFLEFPADFFAGFHPQLHDLANILLENTNDGIAGLQVDFALREKAAAGEHEQEGDEK